MVSRSCEALRCGESSVLTREGRLEQTEGSGLLRQPLSIPKDRLGRPEEEEEEEAMAAARGSRGEPTPQALSADPQTVVSRGGSSRWSAGRPGPGTRAHWFPATWRRAP